MTLFGSLKTSVTGLSAQSTKMSAISDNIANVSTVGYKRTDVQFATLVTERIGDTTFIPGGVTARPRQTLDIQGIIQGSQVSTDLAVSGDGMFVVTEQPTTAVSRDRALYTRSGSFRPDDSGYLRNAAGFHLQGYTTNRDGTPARDGVNFSALDQNFQDMEPVDVNRIANIAEETDNIAIRANLPAEQTMQLTLTITNGTTSASTADVLTAIGNANTADFTSTVQVFDAEGTPRTLTLQWYKLGNSTQSGTGTENADATPNEWALHIDARTGLDGLQNSTATGSVAGGLVSFVHGFNEAEEGVALNGGTTPGTVTNTLFVKFNGRGSLRNVWNTLETMRAETNDAAYLGATAGTAGVDDLALGNRETDNGERPRQIGIAAYTANNLSAPSAAELDAVDNAVRAAVNAFGAGAAANSPAAFAEDAVTDAAAAANGGAAVTAVRAVADAADTAAADAVRAAVIAAGAALAPNPEAAFATAAANAAAGAANGAAAVVAVAAVAAGGAGANFVAALNAAAVAAEAGGGDQNAVANAVAAAAVANDPAIAANVDAVPAVVTARATATFAGTLRDAALAAEAGGGDQTAVATAVANAAVANDAGIAGAVNADAAVVAARTALEPFIPRAGSGREVDIANTNFATDFRLKTGMQSGDTVQAQQARSPFSEQGAQPLFMELFVGRGTTLGDSRVGAAGTDDTFDGTGLDGFTQFDSGEEDPILETLFIQQDGIRTGTVAGVSVSAEGLVSAIYDNGMTRPIYQLALAKFANYNGLVNQSGNVYQESDDSGDVLLAKPKLSGLGQILGGAVENANVDLGSEFTDMIITQQAFTANTRSITTTDEMLTDINNLIR